MRGGVGSSGLDGDVRGEFLICVKREREQRGRERNREKESVCALGE